MEPRNYDYDDLGGVDLSKLDLSHIDLDIEQPPSRIWRVFALLGFAGMAGLLLWYPTTPEYQQLGANSWVFFVICGGATVVGLLGGRWLLRWAQEAAADYARRRRPEATPEPPGPPSTLRRWLTLVLVVGGGAGILFGLPAAGYLRSGHGGGTVWFGAAIAAVVVGVLLGRWLMMQGEVVARDSTPRQPIRLPSWFKWVTLAAILIVGAGALVVPLVYSGSDGESIRFGIGGVGFVVGIVAAIWLAKRFEETEQKIREQTRRERGAGSDRQPTAHPEDDF